MAGIPGMLVALWQKTGSIHVSKTQQKRDWNEANDTCLRYVSISLFVAFKQYPLSGSSTFL